MDRKKVGEILKELRKEKGVTQAEVADKIGVSVAAYNMYEAGIRIPRDPVKEAICEYFQKQPGYIFFS